MKKNRTLVSRFGLSWKVFFYFLAFAVMVMFFFWLFQIVFLNQFYRTSKINEATKVVEELAIQANKVADLERINLETEVINQLTFLAKNFELDIIIYYINNKYDCIPVCMTTNIVERNEITAWVQRIANQIAQGTSTMKEYENRGGSIQTSVVYTRARFMTTRNGQNCAVVVESRLVPVESIQTVLMTQFRFIIMIMFFLSLLFATIMSYQIAKPIMVINQSAKKLAKGQLEADFKGRGYREIDELNETLNYAARELGKLDRYQKELIANISHDLRTPLTLIAGYSEMMRDLPGEANSENLQVVIDETKRLTTLVNDILDLTKIQSNSKEPDLKTINLTEAIEEIIQRQNALAKNLDFTIVFQYENPVWILADVDQIGQVIYNFISNALNYSGDSREIIVKQVKTDNFVTISVIDYGIGIPEDKLNDVWQRYYKIETNHQRGHAASGLGLTIVKSILDNHNFEYGVNSKVGIGSEFWFKAPLEKSPKNRKEIN